MVLWRAPPQRRIRAVSAHAARGAKPMKRTVFPAMLAVLACAPAQSWAHGEARCPGFFYEGRLPELQGIFAGGPVLCNAAYAAMDSAVSRGPIWSAELLTEENLEVAAKTKRSGHFYPDARLPRAARSELDDYRGSGMDRGHLSPSGDFAGEAVQEQSYALSNVVPQAPGLNRGAWEGIESAVRGLTNQDGRIYVVTGVLFPDADRKRIGPDGVMVPSGMWKAVFDPVAGGAAVYVCNNVDHPGCKVVSLTVLQSWAGIDVFPTLPEAVKAHVMPLPAIEESPYAMTVRSDQSRHKGFDWNDRRVRSVLRLLQKALKAGG